MDLYWRWSSLFDKSGHLQFCSDLVWHILSLIRRQIIEFVTTKLFPSQNHYWIKTTLLSKLLFEFIFHLIAFYVLDLDFTKLICIEKLNPIHFDELYQSWILITTGGWMTTQARPFGKANAVSEMIQQQHTHHKLTSNWCISQHFIRSLTKKDSSGSGGEGGEAVA